MRIEVHAINRLGQPKGAHRFSLMQVRSTLLRESGRQLRPFLDLVQPVFHFFPGDRGALTAQELKSVKLTLRIHCKLRYKAAAHFSGVLSKSN